MKKKTENNGVFHVGLVFAVSLAVGVILLAAFLHLVGFRRIIVTIQSVDIRLVFLAFLLDMTGLVLYGACWYVLLRSAGLKIRFLSCISIALAGIFTCYITPSGFFMDASRVLLASKESDISIGDGAATVILHKIIFILGFVTYGLLAMAMLFASYGLSQALAVNVLGLIAVVAAGIVGLTLIIVKGEKLRDVAPGLYEGIRSKLERICCKYLPKAVSSIGGVAKDFRSTFRKLVRNPMAMLVSYALALAYWATSVMILYVVFLALGYHVSIWAIMLTISIGDFIQMTPIAIPGMLGVLEVVTTTVLVMFGVPLSVAASATLLGRIATFWFDIPVTGAAASYYGVKYVASLAMSMSRPSK